MTRPGVAQPFYARVQQELADRGWTDERFKAETGVARSTMTKWKTGLRPPMKNTIAKVAHALDIDLAEAMRLAGRTEEPFDGVHDRRRGPADRRRGDNDVNTVDAAAAWIENNRDDLSPEEYDAYKRRIERHRQEGDDLIKSIRRRDGLY